MAVSFFMFIILSRSRGCQCEPEQSQRSMSSWSCTHREGYEGGFPLKWRNRAARIEVTTCFPSHVSRLAQHEPEVLLAAFSARSRASQSSGSAERLADLPVVTKRVDDASNPPTVALGNRCNFGCSCGNGLLEHCVRVVYGQDHPNGRSAAQGLRTRVCVLLYP